MGYREQLSKGKVKILGQIYSFGEDKNMGRDSKCIGTSCGNSIDIKIDSTLPMCAKQTTLIHEIIEQLDYLLELNLEHNKIQSLEAGLFAVIIDNPGLFNFEGDST